MTDAAEEKLILQARAGNRKAFAELVRAHQGWVFHLAYQCLANQQDAEDAAQEVFVCAFHKLRSYRGDAAFGTWLRRIALNVCLARLRRRPPPEPLSALEERGIVLPPPDDPDPYVEVERAELARAVRAAVARLPQVYQEVVALRYFDELSYDEIARTLKVPVGTVRSRLNKARTLLRGKLFRQVMEDDETIPCVPPPAKMVNG